MIATWALLLCTPISSDYSQPKNLDLEKQLQHWEGKGFERTSLKSLQGKPAISSKNYRGGEKPALLYQTFILPKNAGTLHFHAYSTASNKNGDRYLDVFLEGARRRVIPKRARFGNELKDVEAVLPSKTGELREYVWSVADLAGSTVRIVAVDMSSQPGRYLVSSGFHLRPNSALRNELFRHEIAKLVHDHELLEVRGFSSPHFYALSNAEIDFTKDKLMHCEILYTAFLRHFQKKGFELSSPAEKLHVAIFRSQKGYEAYLGAPVGTFITGVYQSTNNCLVVYDFGRNRELIALREKAQKRVLEGRTELERKLLGAAMSHQLNEVRIGTNASTLMHETAHQLSYNCGLLNRQGDTPLWLAEGLACYCEATRKGQWAGVGEISDGRARTLKQALQKQGQLLPLSELLQDDNWLRGPKGAKYALTGYAQSWALFHALMEERPRSLRKYLELIYERRTPDHRLTDFTQAFGMSIAEMERRHLAYVKDLVKSR